eukprot:6722553-Pyramimonas_sp.AAC.1
MTESTTVWTAGRPGPAGRGCRSGLPHAGGKCYTTNRGGDPPPPLAWTIGVPDWRTGQKNGPVAITARHAPYAHRGQGCWLQARFGARLGSARSRGASLGHPPQRASCSRNAPERGEASSTGVLLAVNIE